MPSKEYYEGREMENNMKLHSHLINIFKFDSIEKLKEQLIKDGIIAEENNLRLGQIGCAL